MRVSVHKQGAGWLVPAGLLLLGLVPLIVGALRITQLAGGPEVMPPESRFAASPLPLALHIISVTLYSLLGAFQFASSFRRRRRGWHRAAGRILIPSGLIAALSGLWMTLFYPWPLYDGELVYGLRLVFGSAMLVSLLLGAAAIWRRDFTQHGAWMIRGYAIGLGAGTQVLTHLPWFLFPAIQSEQTRALFMGAGWVINLAVAEWIIRRRPARPAHKIAAATSQLQ